MKDEKVKVEDEIIVDDDDIIIENESSEESETKKKPNILKRGFDKVTGFAQRHPKLTKAVAVAVGFAAGAVTATVLKNRKDAVDLEYEDTKKLELYDDDNADDNEIEDDEFSWTDSDDETSDENEEAV